VAAEDGWQSAIHGCKKDGKMKRLDKDKRQDLKEKEGGCHVEKNVVCGW
jgi:hypothetical protein